MLLRVVYFLHYMCPCICRVSQVLSQGEKENSIFEIKIISLVSSYDVLSF